MDPKYLEAKYNVPEPPIAEVLNPISVSPLISNLYESIDLVSPEPKSKRGTFKYLSSAVSAEYC